MEDNKIYDFHTDLVNIAYNIRSDDEYYNAEVATTNSVAREKTGEN